MSVDVRCHTALHILKGAVQKVLGAKWTTGVSTHGSHGRLTVQFDRKPTEDEIHRIEELANEKVRADDPIEIHGLTRREAEERWGNAIYDLFPLPEHIKELTIFELPGWNVNACNKEHTASTGPVGAIKISKARYRATKQLLEISFDVEE